MEFQLQNQLCPLVLFLCVARMVHQHRDGRDVPGITAYARMANNTMALQESDHDPQNRSYSTQTKCVPTLTSFYLDTQNVMATPIPPFSWGREMKGKLEFK